MVVSSNVSNQLTDNFFLNDALVIKILPRIWPNDYFERTPPKRADYPNEASYHAVNHARNEVVEFYHRHLCYHIEACAGVVGMIATMTNMNPTQVADSNTIGNSLRADWSALNVKRACFIFHFSLNNSYLSVFEETFSQKMERKFLVETNTVYSGFAVSNTTGCIAQLGSKTLNSVKWTVERNLKDLPVKFSVRKPKDWTLGEFTGNNKGRLNNQYYVTVVDGQYMVSGWKAPLVDCKKRILTLVMSFLGGP